MSCSKVFLHTERLFRNLHRVKAVGMETLAEKDESPDGNAENSAAFIQNYFEAPDFH
jgi:hypothetical protein